jgi:hypothetical protein
MIEIRNRIRGHRRVRAGDVLPHELNYRLHPQAQREALEALYRKVGFARSLLAFELPDGRLKLIDGHLRRELHPDQEVDVEIVDLNEEEARVLLLSLDPLAALAGRDEEMHAELARLTPSDEQALNSLWRIAEEAKAAEPEASPALREQFLILVECADERTQADLLARFQAEGLACRALLS